MRHPRASIALALALGLAGTASQAQAALKDWFDTATIYHGQGVDLNLQQVPEAIITGDWRKEDAHFFGVGLGKVRGTLGHSMRELRGSPFANFQHGYEVIYVQHRGRQTNSELSAAYYLRTPNLEVGPLGVNFAAGGGLSHAFGTPTYEDGSASDPNRRYRTQFYGLLELEWLYLPAPQFSLVSRIHHRSGIYGLVAPRRVGSNFLTVGLRYRF